MKRPPWHEEARRLVTARLDRELPAAVLDLLESALADFELLHQRVKALEVENEMQVIDLDRLRAQVRRMARG